MKPESYKADALRVVYAADEPLTSREVGQRMSAKPSDTSTVMKDLYDEDYVDREGEGKRGDAYRYTITGKGEAAARDLNGDGEPDGPAGLEALFDAEGEEMDYVSLTNDAVDADVEYGTRYRATVNNTEAYGVFVSLNDAADDVTGLIHKSRIPNGHDADSFTAGDKVGVMLTDERDEGLDFEMVAAFDTVRGITFERHPSEAPEDPKPDHPPDEWCGRDECPSCQGYDHPPDEAPEAEVKEDDEPDEDTEVEPDAVDRLIGENVDALAHTVEALEDRIGGLEDVVGKSNVEREDARHRLRQLEDAVDGAEHVVAFDDKEFVETVLMVAQSDYGGATKKRHVLSTLLGVEDAEEKGLLSRALSAAASNAKAEGDTADQDDADGGATE